MNPEQELATLEQLLDELLRGIQDLLQSGEILTDEFQMMLAQELEATTQRIDFLRSEISQEPIEEIPPIPPEKINLSRPMPSSNIHSFGYDDKNGRLLVKFQDKWPNQNGPVYAYDGVPQSIYEIFRRGAVPARTKGQNRWGRWWVGKNPSLGASLYTLINQGGYPYQRLT